MNTFLITILQCGAFLLIPIGTFAVGLWLIVHFVGMNSKWSSQLIALLLGFIFFEASAIGMLIDPRGGLERFPEIIRTSIAIGIITTIVVVIFIPIFRMVSNLFK